jgi:arsenate reductase
MEKKQALEKVLFICTHNSARSHMAEGFMNALYGDRYSAFSAGTEPSTVNPYAVRVMKEIGIDISDHRSKSVDEFIDQDLDYVVTVCDHAKEVCRGLTRVRVV